MQKMPPFKWSPAWCAHVEGYFYPRTEDMDPEDPQVIDMVCLVCRTHWRAFCWSGRVDKRVERFAILHRECWYRTVPSGTDLG
jgi:hypothetical protein